MKPDEAFEHVSHLIEKINHVNAGKRRLRGSAVSASVPTWRGLPSSWRRVPALE